MPVDIDKAYTKLMGRFIEVLKASLAGHLSTQESQATGSYPLSDAEEYILARYDIPEVWRRFNVDGTAIWITQDSPSQTQHQVTGSPEKRTNDQDTIIKVGSVSRQPDGVDQLPTTLPDGTDLGRRLSMKEWMHFRGELYKGAIINCITENLQDGESAGGVELESNFAQNQDPENFGGHFSTAVADFAITQEVQLLRRDY